jgi:hypothetical protein
MSTDAPSGYQLQRVISQAQQTIEALRTEHGQVFDTEDDVLTALSEEGISVDDILRRLISSALNDKASAAVAKQRMADLKIRLERFERNEDTKRGVAAMVMEALLPANEKGTRSFRDVEFSLTLAPGKPKVFITDPNALPSYLINEVTTRVPDKRAIAAELETGPVPGAILSNGGSVLTIRSK